MRAGVIGVHKVININKTIMLNNRYVSPVFKRFSRKVAIIGGGGCYQITVSHEMRGWCV